MAFRGKDVKAGYDSTNLAYRFAAFPKIRAYHELLKRAGREVVENRRISEKTIAELEKPLLPKEMHVEISKRRWDQAISLGRKVWVLTE